MRPRITAPQSVSAGSVVTERVAYWQRFRPVDPFHPSPANDTVRCLLNQDGADLPGAREAILKRQTFPNGHVRRHL